MASTLPPVPSGVIRLMHIYLIVFVVVIIIVVVALEISTLHTSYHQLSPSNQQLPLSVASHAQFERTDKANSP